MTPTSKKRIVAGNAGIWVISILASFILPLVAASASSGNAGFLKLLCFALPLLIGMTMSTILISKSVADLPE